jgi:hypothetical protein
MAIILFDTYSNRRYNISEERRWRKMLKMNVCNLERFFEVVNQCEKPVMLVVPDGNAEELRGNVFVQDLLLEMRNGITQLSIEADPGEDTMRLILFMMEDGRSLAECPGSSLLDVA